LLWSLKHPSETWNLFGVDC